VKAETRKGVESVVHKFLMACAAVSILSVGFITLFILIEGLPLFFVSEQGHAPPSLAEFLFGTEWYPTGDPPSFGILPFITASLMVTAGALIFAVPIGIAVGIFISEMSRGRSQTLLTSTTEILAGIPSVVYGFFGVMMIGFFLENFEDPLVNYNAFSAMIILAVMTLPTIINITAVSLRAVPQDYREGAYAIGSTQWQTIWRVLIPSARGGILTGCILGMGRAVGETLAVLMVAGNQPTMPMNGLASRVRTLTMAIINDMGYAAGDHRVALFTTGIVLFAFILILNITTQIISRRSQRQRMPADTLPTSGTQ
jgi:phosphate transport system permease protein